MRDFKRFLKKRYGHFVRAWRKVLAPEGGMVVHKNDLFKASIAMAWEGDVRMLWSAFDKDESGYITMEELDSPSATSLAYFKRFVDEKFGNTSKAFRAFDKQKKRRLTQGEFVEAVKGAGFHLPAGPLYGAFDINKVKVIKEEDMQFLNDWKPTQFLLADANAEAAEEVRGRLLSHYRSYLKAWRHILDADGSNRCNWDEFAGACKKIGFKGDIPGAWRHFDEDLSGFLTLSEFDPVSSKLLAKFKHWCDEEFGGVRSAFGVFDSDGSNEVSYREFRRSCRIYGFEGDCHLLFYAMDLEKRGELTLKEVLFLDAWEFESPDDTEDDQAFGDDTGDSFMRGVIAKGKPQSTSCTTSYCTDTPGPASYDIPSSFSAGPWPPMTQHCGAYTFRKRPKASILPSIQDIEKPSPGQYDEIVGRSLAWQHKPAWVFGSEKRVAVLPLEFGSSELPGPGTYSPPRVVSSRGIRCVPRRPLRVHPLMRLDGGLRGGLPNSAR